MTAYLIDTSVLNRVGRSEPVRRALEQRGTEGPLYRCAIVDLEVLRGVPAGYYVPVRESLAAGYIDLPISAETCDRARTTQAALAEASQHQGVKIPDLLIAAAAVEHGATVLHYDADYDAIAAVTGQPTQWVVDRGAAD